MRVLLVHPEDDLQQGPWSDLRWDRVVDLGRAGMEAYARARSHYGCPVTSFYESEGGSENFKNLQRVRDLFARGAGRLTDRYGLDWWELTSIRVHAEVETAIRLQKFAAGLGAGDEIHISKPGFEAKILKLATGDRLHMFPSRANSSRRGPGHYFHVARKFPPSQLLEIFWDKADPGYQLRGWFNGKRKPQQDPVVLLPTAYVSVSRTGIAYANTVPDANFLLVATRRSGWVANPPANVETAWLRSYASVRPSGRTAELKDLMERWGLLRNELDRIPEFNTLSRLGGFDEFPYWFARGLEIRDAWRNVLETEPLQAVICVDDSNPYTHIPLLLAKEKGLPTISCHHGALDGRCVFKRVHADTVLVKGKMEEDYLERMCGLPAKQVEIGAPAGEYEEEEEQISGGDKKSCIVVFSEAYEAMGGRGRDVYQDILPALADLALSEGRVVVVKLHPAESLAERKRIIRQTLSPDQQQVVSVVGGPLRSELLDKTWFGITILSTVAVECALKGIPCFLCKWLESSPYGYVDQFTRFGVGIRLDQPDEIKRIPFMLQNYMSDPHLRKNCGTPIQPERLRILLGLSPPQQVATSGADRDRPGL
jgi:hypothetical protein